MSTLYCKITDGQLGRIQPLPVKYANLTDDDLVLHEWYPFIAPEYDHILQTLDGLYYDSVNKVVTKNVIDLNHNISNEKLRIEIELTQVEHSIIFNMFDWYATRKVKFGTDIPQAILNEELNFKAFCDVLRTELNACTNVSDVLTFDIYDRINTFNGEYLQYIKNEI